MLFDVVIVSSLPRLPKSEPSTFSDGFHFQLCPRSLVKSYLSFPQLLSLFVGDMSVSDF